MHQEIIKRNQENQTIFYTFFWDLSCLCLVKYAQGSGEIDMDPILLHVEENNVDFSPRVNQLKINTQII